MKKISLLLAATLLLASCVQKPGQDVYKAGEVGESRAVEFGTVINVREVKIAADNNGGGMLLGAGTGAGLGSYGGGGSGQVWSTAAGAIVGGIIGNEIEESVGASTGYEYTIQLLDGDVKTIVQEKIEGDKVFKAGDKVMLQQCDAGEYNRKCSSDTKNRRHQRLLPVQKFPSQVKAKKAKKHVIEVDADDVDGAR